MVHTTTQGTLGHREQRTQPRAYGLTRATSPRSRAQCHVCAGQRFAGGPIDTPRPQEYRQLDTTQAAPWGAPRADDGPVTSADGHVKACSRCREGSLARRSTPSPWPGGQGSRVGACWPRTGTVYWPVAPGRPSPTFVRALTIDTPRWHESGGVHREVRGLTPISYGSEGRA